MRRPVCQIERIPPPHSSIAFLSRTLASPAKTANIPRLMKEFWLATFIWLFMALALAWSILLAVKGNAFPLLLVTGAFAFGIGKIGCAPH